MTEPATPRPEPASLNALVLSMAAATLAGLGKTVIPGDDTPEVNLPLAQQSIDTLAMLRVKTEGNRTEEETRLLDELLYELRLLYVKAEAAGQDSAAPRA
jgi:hypothetical protein